PSYGAWGPSWSRSTTSGRWSGGISARSRCARSRTPPRSRQRPRPCDSLLSASGATGGAPGRDSGVRWRAMLRVGLATWAADDEPAVELGYRDVGLARLMADVATIMRGVRPGEVLFLHTDTADAWEAVPAWCIAHGHQIVWCSNTGEGTLEGAPTY